MIRFGPGSGHTISKGESEDPDPLFPNVDPRIRLRINVKMRWIRNAAPVYFVFYFRHLFKLRD